jgi:hypothetical protein
MHHAALGWISEPQLEQVIMELQRWAAGRAYFKGFGKAVQQRY